MSVAFTPGPNYPTSPRLLYRLDVGRARNRLLKGRPVSKRFRALIAEQDKEIASVLAAGSGPAIPEQILVLPIGAVTDAIRRATPEERADFFAALTGEVAAP